MFSLFAQVLAASAQPGSLDAGYVPETPSYGNVTDIAEQADGKIVFCSQLYPYQQVSRLLTTGAADTNFARSYFTNASVRALALDAQGRILLAGDFLSVQNQPRQRIARLNTNGLLDATFAPVGADYDVTVLAVQTNGQIIVGGPFTAVNGMARHGVARLNPDGSLDPRFNPGSGVANTYSDVIQAIAVLPDGRIAIAGNFTTYNGVTRNRVALLNSDGSLDPNFDPDIGPDAVVNAILVQPDGKILLGGAFTNVCGQLCRRIARLNANGSIDTTFAAIPGFTTSDFANTSRVGTLGLQADGSVLVGGQFEYANGVKRRGLARLLSDGSLDYDWDAQLPGTISALGPAPGGWYVAGGFSSVQGSTRFGLARLNSVGSPNAGSFEFSSAQFHGREADGMLQITVRRTGGTLRSAGVTCSTQDGTAQTPNDYLAVTTNLVFATGQILTDVCIPLIDNGRADDVGCCSSYGDVINGGFLDRNVFVVGLSKPTGAAKIGSQAYSVGVIAEKDTRFAFASSNYSVAELTGFVDIQVKRIGNKESDHSVMVATRNGTAQAGIDYAAISEPLVFLPGQPSRTCRVRILENPLNENRSFQVVLTNPSTGTGLTNPAAATVTIQSQPGLEVSTWPGAVDTGFSPGNGVSPGVYSLALQSDLKLIVGGGFDAVDGATRYKLARLHPDGRLDTAYVPSVEMHLYEVHATTILSEGRLAVAGRTRGDFGEKGLLVFQANGSPDPVFDCGSGPGYGNGIDVIIPQPDGRILVGGDFNQFDGAPALLLTRLNTDGSRDVGFQAYLGTEGPDWPSLHALALQTDGKIVVGGSFSATNEWPRRGLTRLLPSGSVDSSFNPAWLTGGSIRSLGLQSDGSVIIGGEFSVFARNEPVCVARVLPNGDWDTNFHAVAQWDSGVHCLLVQPDDKVLIGGVFTTLQGLSRNRIARLNANGSLDLTFDPGSGANGPVYSIVRQPDGAAFIGGQFDRVDGRLRPGIARLFGGDPPLTAPFFRSEPLGRVIKEGENLSFEAFVRGFPLPALQWTLNGQPIVGATAERLNLVNVKANQSGNYALVAWNSQGTNISATALLQVTPTSSQPGNLDLSFYPGAGVSVPMINYEASVTGLSVDGLGRTWIAGNFSRLDGRVCGGIARLLPDGNVDPAFVLGVGVEGGNINSLALQPDGKAVIAGWFFHVNGVYRSTIARLNADGTVDEGFNAGSGADQHIYSAVVQANGKIVVAGDFSSFNGQPRKGIARLNPDGTLEDSFHSGDPAQVRGFALALQPDGTIILGGHFTTINGVPRNDVARFNPDGTLDLAFTPAGAISGTVFGVAVQPDGKIVVGGNFEAAGGSPRRALTRFLPDGALDPSFNPGVGPNAYYVRTILLQNHDRILATGPFTTFNNVPRNGLVRLLRDGSVDPTFDSGTGPQGGEIYALGLQGDGRIVAGGGFTNFDARPRAGIARLHNSADSAAGRLVIAPSRARIWENGGTNLALKVQRLDGSNGHVRVNYAVAAGTAKPGIDYQPLSGTLEFAAGTAEFSIPVSLINNQVAQGDRMLNVWLGTPCGGATWGTNAAARLVIVEDDTALEFASTKIYCQESQGLQPVTVRRLGRLDSTVTVSFFTTNGTALLGTDYSVVPGALTFGAGISNQTFSIEILEDGVSEPDLTVGLELTNPGGGALLTTNSSAELTIFDNDRPGTLDTGFNAPLCGPYSSPFAKEIAVQRDGRPVVVLQETATVYPAEALARFLPNGAVDPSFSSPFGSQLSPYLTISSLVALPDDRLLVGGVAPNEYGFEATNFVLRLLRDGQIDPGFRSPVFAGGGSFSQVNALVCLPSGQVVVSGSFYDIDGVRISSLARLSSDGRLDTGFNTMAWTSNTLVGVQALAATSEGKIILAGLFYNPADDTYSYRIARINDDGARDGSFNPTARVAGQDGLPWSVNISSLLVQADGKVVAAGQFSLANGLARTNLARFNADGSLDPTLACTFDTGRGNSWLQAAFVQPDGKLVVGGTFSAVNGITCNGLARLAQNGTLDTMFSSGPASTLSAALNVTVLGPQLDGGILVGCRQYQPVGLPTRCGLIRINGTRTAGPRWINAVVHPPGGNTKLQFYAPSGTVYWVQGSTNWNDWQTLGPALDLGGGEFEFIDAQSAGISLRLYRLLCAD